MGRPDSDEYNEYYHQYVSQVPDGDIIEILGHQSEEVVTLLGGLDPRRGDYRYEPGKWSIKQVVGHLGDVERLFSMRALAFSREDPTELPAFDQDVYVAGADFDARTLHELTEEFRHLRAANVSLFRGCTGDHMSRRGVASGFEFTVRAVAYILAGHAIHHLRVIRERYL